MTQAIEDTARLAYGAFQHRTGDETPWERLSNDYRQGWLEAVQTATEQAEDESPECPVCERALRCIHCEAGNIPCAHCDSDLACPTCEARKAKEAAVPHLFNAGGAQ